MKTMSTLEPTHLVLEGALTAEALEHILREVQDGVATVNVEIDPSSLQIGDLIGSGASSKVFRGIWKGSAVAIKHYSQEECLYFDISVFRSEVAILSLCSHPNLVPCLGACTQEPSNLYVVTEYLPRGLDSLLQERKIDFLEAICIALDIASAMKYLHSLKLIHRDLKTKNIMLTDDMITKLIDFGTTRLVDTDAMMTCNLGTVQYMAPEQFKNQRYSEKADVFAFGIILWELVSQQVPYSEVDSFAIPYAVIRGDRPTIPPKTLPGFARLIRACWHSDPTKRPSFVNIYEALKVLCRATGRRSHGKRKNNIRSLLANTGYSAVPAKVETDGARSTNFSVLNSVDSDLSKSARKRSDTCNSDPGDCVKVVESSSSSVGNETAERLSFDEFLRLEADSSSVSVSGDSDRPHMPYIIEQKGPVAEISEVPRVRRRRRTLADVLFGRRVNSDQCPVVSSPRGSSVSAASGESLSSSHLRQTSSLNAPLIHHDTPPPPLLDLPLSVSDSQIVANEPHTLLHRDTPPPPLLDLNLSASDSPFAASTETQSKSEEPSTCLLNSGEVHSEGALLSVEDPDFGNLLPREPFCSVTCSSKQEPSISCLEHSEGTAIPEGQNKEHSLLNLPPSRPPPLPPKWEERDIINEIEDENDDEEEQGVSIHPSTRSHLVPQGLPPRPRATTLPAPPFPSRPPPTKKLVGLEPVPPQLPPPTLPRDYL